VQVGWASLAALVYEAGALPRICHILHNKEIVIMKKLSLTILATVVLLGFAAAIVWAAPPEGEGPDLVPTEISWALTTIYPGDDVTIEITYMNQGTTGVPAEMQVRYRTTITATGTITPVNVYEGDWVTISGAVGLEPGDTRKVSEVITAPSPGNYWLNVTLEANEMVKTKSVSFPVESALPPGLARLFAGLGMFAAVMAIMAVGTEVVIDSFKFFVGLKQKVTAMEALDSLKEELPGQLAELGVDPESQERIDELFKELEATLHSLKGMLKPLESAQDVYEAIKDGELAKAFEGIKDLETEIRKVGTQLGVETDENKRKTLEEETEKKLGELKEAAKKGISDVLSKLGNQFGLDETTVGQFEKTLQGRIDGITLKTVLDPDYTLVGDVFRRIQEKGPQWTADWLRLQADTYLAFGKKQVVNLLDGDVIPILKDLGFSAENVQNARAKLVEKIDGFEILIRGQAATYTLAVRNLLMAVERKRDDMQSPARKIYRRLRDSHLPLSVFIGVVVAIFTSIVWLARAWWPVWKVSGWLAKCGVALGIGLGIGLLTWAALGVVVGLVIGAVKALSKRKQNRSKQVRWEKELWAGLGTQCPWAKRQGQQDENEAMPAVDDGSPPPLGSLGYALRYWFERFFNWILGRQQDPDLYGKIDQEAREQIDNVDPTTVASVVLQREDKHRDEEASRIRILRIISIFVGAALAYALQMDALILLEQALPGAAKFNITVWSGEKLRGLWPALTYDLTAGIILTGLAASAGSKFWRDLLGRLQASKQQAESAAVLLRKGKAMLGVAQEE
jgi:hypothetical protein